MKKKPKRNSKPAVIPAETLLTAPLVASATLALDGMISSLQGMLGDFDRPVEAQVKQLIRLTTALRDQASLGASDPGAAPRPKRRRKL
jgi:hypothetical protein